MWCVVKRHWVNIGLVLVLGVGLILVFNQPIKDEVIHSTTKQYQVTHVARAEIEKNEQAEASFDVEAVEPISSEAVLRATFNHKRLPVIGGVAVPSVGVNLPIFKGLANEALLWGAGTMSPSQVMGQGNYQLASHHSHREDLLFAPLKYAQTGQKIYLTDLDKIYTYTITMVKIVDPAEVKWLDEIPGEELVTLVTCDSLAGVNRIVVQGKLAAVATVAQAESEARQAFELEQKTY